MLFDIEVLLGIAIAIVVVIAVKNVWRLPSFFHHEADDESVRAFVISTFEYMCIAFVVIPTALIIIVFALGAKEQTDVIIGLLIAALTFLVLAFFAGGALTLLSIAHSAADICRVLRRLERVELRPSAEDVHRMQRSERGAPSKETEPVATLPNERPSPAW